MPTAALASETSSGVVLVIVAVRTAYGPARSAGPHRSLTSFDLADDLTWLKVGALDG